MHHACDQRFDVTENLENFCKLNKASLVHDLRVKAERHTTRKTTSQQNKGDVLDTYLCEREHGEKIYPSADY